MNQLLKNFLTHSAALLGNTRFRVYCSLLLSLTILVNTVVFFWPKKPHHDFVRQAIKIPSQEVSKQLIKPPNLVNYSIKYVIQQGDNLGDVLANYGIPEATLDRILKFSESRPLRKIMTGREIEILQNDNSPLLRLTYHYQFDKDLVINKTDDGFEAKVINLPIKKQNVLRQTIITYSLFSACQQAGIPANLVKEFIGKFAWDIDFAKDIREGDKVSMIYEELYNGDKRVGTGHLLAAAFVNHGKTYSLFRYTINGETDYYTGDGRTVKKRFLRAPVNFSHISSLFNLARMHPILHRIRAHQGVDYAAPYGTPIHATGNGRIVFRGRKGGYGNAIIINHGNDYTTLYGHMSRFANKSLGSRVKQGELIGYVGATGLATANHVHYEFRIHEKHYDPLKIKLPKSIPIPEKYLPDFYALVRKFMTAMKLPSESNA